MPRERDFVYQSPLPSWFVNRLQDRFAGLTILPMRAASATSVRISATAEDPAALNIDGKWRFRTTDLEKTHPGGAAGAYSLWITAGLDSSSNTPNPGTDTTNYDFDMVIRLTTAGAPAVTAGTELRRAVAVVTWDGSQIVSVAPYAGAAAASDPRFTTPSAPAAHAATHMAGGGDQVALVPVGGIVMFTAFADPAGDQSFLVPDGRTLTRSSYPALWNLASVEIAAGRTKMYGPGNGSTTFTIPDLRDVFPVFAANLSAAGDPGRLTSPSQLGDTGGAERVTLSDLESGVNPNGSTTTLTASHVHVGLSDGANFSAITVPEVYFAQAAPGTIGAIGVGARSQTSSASTTHAHSLAGRAASNSHENLPPYKAMGVLLRVR